MAAGTPSYSTSGDEGNGDQELLLKKDAKLSLDATILYEFDPDNSPDKQNTTDVANEGVENNSLSESSEWTTADVRRGMAHSLAGIRDEISTVTAILVELAESYQTIIEDCSWPPVELPLVGVPVVGRFFGFAGTVLSYGQLEMIVQEALAAYEWNVLRVRRTKSMPPPGYDGWGDGDQPDEKFAISGGRQAVVKRGVEKLDDNVSEWAAMISSKVEGRLRRNGAVHVTSADEVHLRHSKVPDAQISSPNGLVKQQIQRIDELIFLNERRLREDVGRLETLGRRWAQNRSRSFFVRVFRLNGIIRDALSDYV